MNDDNCQTETSDADYLTELSALYEISSIPTGLISPEALGKLAVEKAARLIGAPIGLLYRRDEDNEDVLRLWEVSGMPAAEVGSLAPQHEAIARVLTRGEPAMLVGTDAVQTLAVLPMSYAASQGVCLPIRSGRRTTALLCLFRLADLPFTRTNLELLTVLAGRVGAALETIRLFAETESHRRELEQEIIERQQVEEALAQSNRELEEFAYIASHDLRQPLRTVKSYLQLLERRYKGQLDQDADEFIAFAVDGAARMEQLIRDLLDYSRVTTDAKPFEKADCSTVLQSVLDDLKTAIEENNAVVTFDPLPTVTGDDTQLRRLFQNLISNAIKFHSDHPPEIHLSAERQKEAWLFSVQDNGIGIAPDDFERIFMIFQRLPAGRAYDGTGIGLAICKKIVERHSGHIWLTSESGQGTTFYFTIPDQDDDDS